MTLTCFGHKQKIFIVSTSKIGIRGRGDFVVNKHSSISCNTAVKLGLNCFNIYIHSNSSKKKENCKQKYVQKNHQIFISNHSIPIRVLSTDIYSAEPNIKYKSYDHLPGLFVM